jgi:dipeptidyl aminopeptidase/acylaminoacyl peptidase
VARRIANVAAVVVAAVAPAEAQQKPTLTPADYGKWETLGRAHLSPDGGWLAYDIRRVDEENELRVRSLDEDSARVVPFGSDATFSHDGRWLAYTVGLSPEEQKEEDARPSAGLLDLRSRRDTTFEGVSDFDFSDDGAYLALYRDRGEEDEAGDLVVRALTTGAEVPLGNVDTYAWSPSGHLLAVTIRTASGAGGAVQLFDPGTGALRVLDRSDADYTQLTWREDDDDLAVLRARSDDGFEEDTHVVLVWRDLGGRVSPALVLDPDEAPGFPVGMRIAESMEPAWSADGRSVFIGLRPRERSEVEDEAPAADSVGGEEGDDAEDAEGRADEEKRSEVQVWTTDDVRIIPMQRAQEDRDLERTLLATWRVDDGRVVQLGTDLMAPMQLLEGGRDAIEFDEKPYERDAMFGRSWQDIYRVDARSGERARVLDKVRYAYAGSPEGRYVLYFQGDDWWSLDLTNGTSANLTGTLDGDFADRTYDYPVAQLPPQAHRPLGWIDGEAAVLLRDRLDVWAVRPDGSGGNRLTDGAAEAIEYDVVALDPDADFFDSSQPLYLSLFGKKTKRSGFARVDLRKANGGYAARGEVRRLVWEDASVSRLAKADDASVFAYVAQRFDDSPDVFVGGPGLDGARQVTHTNPFQDGYAWGRAETVDFISRAGVPLQATLLYPAGWEAGRRYPMIVYTYELLSDGVHRYEVPSERDYYDFQAWTQEGYFVLQPDIVYRPRDPGISAVDAVVPAVAKIVDMGLVDADRVGLIGHSWGGYQAAFIPTQTDIFATSVSGAPLTDFLSMPGSLHWRPGFPEFGHWETGQARMDVPPWEDFDAHVRNSPVAHIQNLHTPMLLMQGDDDGTVDFRQGVEFYNYGRRAGKELVFLVYPGEDHGLRREEDQKDYHRRIVQWFAHWLKGEPAPDWMAGVSWLERKKELSR